MFLVQYLLFPILFVLLALIAIKWKRAGLVLHLVIIVVCMIIFSGASFHVLGFLILIPFALLAILYYLGDPYPRKLAYTLIIALPCIIVIAVSIPQAVRVSKRLNTEDYTMQIVAGNEVTLCFAPRGPGWPDRGVSWYEAQEICSYLSEDGTTIMEEQQNIWRLPTVSEAVRSMMLHGVNAGGIWNPVTSTTTYILTPDKESPLWDVYSKVIYYWTAETSTDNEAQAYIIVYHGGVFDKTKTDSQDYLSFRAVKSIKND